jgi:MFS family permease
MPRRAASRRRRLIRLYQVASKVLLKPRTWAPGGVRPRVAHNVVMLGFVSLLTDISAEMVATVLPLYLVFSLGASPLVLGAIDGTYRGAAAIVQVFSGLVSDRWHRHKEVAGTGYGLSAVTKVGLVALGSSVGAIGALVAIDRVGKGIRTAPRDALISLSSSKAGLATAFGVHRAMDSAGAMLGPLIAFGILLAAPARFDAIWVVSTLFAFLGLAVLVLAVQGWPERAPKPDSAKPSLRAAAGLVGDRRFRLLLFAAGALALVSVSDALIYVGLQRRIEFEPAVFPLLYVVTALVYMALAIPVGQLADRFGRVRVLVAGHAALLLVYGALLLPSLGVAPLCACLFAMGAYFAATDGVTTALAGALLPDKLQASGIGILTTVVSLGQLVSSVAFGALWFSLGLEKAVLIFAAALLLALLVTAPLLIRSQREPLSG